MRVTVAVCLHDGAAFIGEALCSVLAQTCGDFEIVLVDDGSTDGAADFLESWIRDRRLRIVRTPHRGLGAARALAVERAAGEWIAFLDQDDTWMPAKLERFLEASASSPEAALLFSDVRLVDESGSPIGALSERFDFGVLDLAPGAAEAELLRRGNFIDASAAMARRDAVLEAGNFDPRCRYVEDLDLWLRIARRGRLLALPEALSTRRIHAGQFTQLFSRDRLGRTDGLVETADDGPVPAPGRAHRRRRLSPGSALRMRPAAAGAETSGRGRPRGRRLAALSGPDPGRRPLSPSPPGRFEGRPRGGPRRAFGARPGAS